MDISLQSFDDKGDVPNNPRLPLILYRGAIAAGTRDMPRAFETLFAAHRWGGLWRNGIYPFHHYHSTAHEVLGIGAGSVTVELGGEDGLTCELMAGDAVLIPAGTGHKRLSPSGDLLVVGGYPLDQSADLIKAMDRSVDAEAVRRRIQAVVLPAEDPVEGSSGPMFQAWVTIG